MSNLGVTSGFRQQKARGVEGEKLFEDFIRGCGLDFEKTGHCDETNKEAGLAAPDYVIWSRPIGRYPTGARRKLIGKSVEVKTINVDSENVCIELISNSTTGRPGWTYTCNADYVAFVEPGKNRLLIVGMQVFRKRLGNVRCSDRLHRICDNNYWQVAMLVPREEIEGEAIYNGKIR